jgi:hypothetical protein
MTYIGDDHARMARSYAAQAGGYKRRGEREALAAAESYASARNVREAARWLTGHPDMWRNGFTPAEREASARAHERIGDTYLRMSFRADVMVAHSLDMAARYRVLRDRRAARLAELDA